MASRDFDSRPVALADPALRRSFGLDLDADSWMGRLRGYCAGPSLGMLGPYELLATAGRGGQGLVFKARQPRTGREVAVKRLAAGEFSTPDMKARFQREVEAVAALAHPNIVTVFGSEDIDGQPVLVMQWIDGVPFDRWARPTDGHARSVADVLDAFTKVCDAVHHAHQRGIIHRDLKPSNVLVDRDDEPHVLDFGLARRNDDSSNDACLTLSGAVLGTPAFSPPEQLRGERHRIDQRSDVYSLGALLYRGLTGDSPVDPQLSHGAMAAHIERVTPRLPSAINPQLDGEINAILLKALQADSAQRFTSVAEMAEDVRRYQTGRPVLAHPPGAVYKLKKFARRHAVTLVVAGLATASITAAVINYQLRLRRVNGLTEQEDRRREEFKRLEQNHALDGVFRTAMAMDASRKYAEAEPLYRDVLFRRRELMGDQHVSLIPVAGKLASMLSRQGQYHDADPFYTLAFEASVRNLGLAHRDTVSAGNNLAGNKICRGDYRGAEQICLQFPREDVTVRLGGNGAYLVRALLLQRRYNDAIEVAKLGLMMDIQKYGNEHRYVAADHQNLGDMYRLAGDPVQAKREFEIALPLYQSIRQRYEESSSFNDTNDLSICNIGYLKYRLGRIEEAEIALRKAVAGKFPMENSLGNTRYGVVLAHWGRFLLGTGRGEEGERFLIDGQAMMSDPNYISSRFFLVTDLIAYYEGVGRSAEAAHWRDCLANRPFREWSPPRSNQP